jgi:hypothetical protein
MNKNQCKTVNGTTLFLLLIVGTLFSSCLSDDSERMQPEAAFVSIYHGAPLSPELDIFADSRKISQSPFRFGDNFPYSPFFVGNRKLRFSPYNAVNTLLEENYVFKKDSVYSIFLFNESNQLKTIKILDEWDDPKPDFAQIRIVHLSPDAGKLTLKLNEKTYSSASDLDMGTITEFLEIEKGKYSVDLISAQTQDEILEVGEIDFRGNRVYTIIIRGKVEPSSTHQNLSVQILTNFIEF